MQTSVRGMDYADGFNQPIRDRVEKLDRVYPKLMSCRVVAELQDRHKQQGKHFAVRVDIMAPGREIVVNRQHAEDVYVALRDAFDAAKRQLESYSDIQQGEVKSHSAPPAPPASAGE